MSKFDAILKRIEEQTGTIVQQQPKPGVTPTTPVNNTNQPTAQNTQQQQAHLKNPQAIEKIADEIANINDPNKIKQILAQLVQGITNPQTNS